MPAISTSPSSSLAAAATALASATPPPTEAVDIALVLKIVVPLGVLAILGVVGLIVWLCRTPDYDENAPTNLRKKRPEEDPAPAYDVEAGPPTYFVPAETHSDGTHDTRSEEEKPEEVAVARLAATTMTTTPAEREWEREEARS